MASFSPNPQASKSSDGSARKRRQHVVGAVAGAVLGGVLGAFVVKKVRDGSAKRLVPAKVPALAKRAAGAAKSLAHDAKVVAKATAVVAADAALEQVSKAAQQFMVDVASGQSPKSPERSPHPADAAKTSTANSEMSAAPSEDSPSKETRSAGRTSKKSAAPKKYAAPKRTAKSAK